MKTKNSNLSYLEDENFQELSDFYQKNPIAVYTGAGVSSSEDPTYGIGGWEKLLKDILIKKYGKESPQVKKFNKKVKKNFEPWKLADWMVRKISKKELKNLLIEHIQHPKNFPTSDSQDEEEKQTNNGKKYKLLGGSFLSNAPTLLAISAFCTQLTARVEDARENTYRVSLNPRVRAILTSNYDPFLEAASPTMYINRLLKPIGRFGSDVGNKHQIPVYHIHGYVPYPKKNNDLTQTKVIEPMVDLVLTSADYKKTWREKDVFGFTMGSQIHILRHCCVLFIGFSFRDKWVNNLLFKLNKERKAREELDGKRLFHYTLMKKTKIQEIKDKKGNDFFTKMGVKPIGLDKYKHIPLLLRDLYLKGMKFDYETNDIPIFKVYKDINTKGLIPVRKETDKKEIDEEIDKINSLDIYYLDPDKYWDQLSRCRNRRSSNKKKKEKISTIKQYKEKMKNENNTKSN